MNKVFEYRNRSDKQRRPVNIVVYSIVCNSLAAEIWDLHIPSLTLIIHTENGKVERAVMLFKLYYG
jgi:hypothetical protein